MWVCVCFFTSLPLFLCLFPGTEIPPLRYNLNLYITKLFFFLFKLMVMLHSCHCCNPSPRNLTWPLQSELPDCCMLHVFVQALYACCHQITVQVRLILHHYRTLVKLINPFSTHIPVDSLQSVMFLLMSPFVAARMTFCFVYVML